MPSRRVTFRGVMTWEDDVPIEPPTIEPPIEPPTPRDPLLYAADLEYLGCFRLPPYPTRYDWPPKGMSYREPESLFLTGFADHHCVGQVSIPPLVKGATSLAELQWAGEIQPLQDPTEGTWASLAYGGGINLGGTLDYHDRLIVTAYRFYDANGSQPFSHWSRNLDLGKTGDYVGPVHLLVTDEAGPEGLHAGVVSGYMGHVAPAWQTRFKGPCFTGNAGLSIVTRTSMGPCAFTFNPDDIGKKDPVPTTPLVFYPSTHPTLGPYSPGPDDPNPNPVFNGTMQMGGLCQLVGTRTVLFMGMIGIGIHAYGEGTANPLLNGQPVPGTDGEVIYCYDPVMPAKGDHAYPYVAMVWAYDAEDLAEVAAGERNAWDVVPYATWELHSDFYSWLPRIAAVGYDPKTKRIFVSQTFGDGDTPLIHVYRHV